MTSVGDRLRSVDLAPLFPPAPTAPWSTRWRLLAVVAVLAGTALVLARQPGVGALNTLWAEDGEVFLNQARTEGWWGSITTSYAGYWHLAPRGLAVIASAVPLRDAAASTAVMAALVQSLLALFVFRASSGVIPAVGARIVVASSMLLLPVGQEEVFASIANLHWFLYPAAVWALLWNPSRRGDVVLGCAVLTVAALSDPLLIVITPLAVLRVLAARRGACSAAPAIAFLLAVAAHVLAVLVVQPTRVTEEGTGGPAHALRWFIFDVPGRGIAGARLLHDPDRRLGQLVAVALLLVAGVLLYSGIRRLGAASLPVVALLVGAGLLYLVPTALAGTHPARYSVGPVVLLLSALVAAWPPSPGLRRLAPVAIVALGLVWATNLRLANQRGLGPTWEDVIDDAADACKGADPAEPVELEITPPEGWSVPVTCADVS